MIEFLIEEFLFLITAHVHFLNRRIFIITQKYTSCKIFCLEEMLTEMFRLVEHFFCVFEITSSLRSQLYQ